MSSTPTPDSPLPLGVPDPISATPVNGKARLMCPLSKAALRRAVLWEEANATRLAAEHDVCPATAARWLADAGLQTPDPLLTADLLQALYVRRRLTTRDIAHLTGTGKNRVLRALAAAGIPPHRDRRSNRPAISDEDLRTAYVEERLTLDQLAARFELTTYAVRQRIRALGLTKRRGSHTPRSEWSRERLHSAVDSLQANGLSTAEIASHLGVSTSTVRNTQCAKVAAALYADTDIVDILQRHHVTVPADATWAPPSPWTAYAPLPLQRDLLLDLYDVAGLSIAHIALVCGVSTTQIRSRMAASGVKTRSAGSNAPWTLRNGWAGDIRARRAVHTTEPDSLTG